jgi:hypothetical protein
VSILSLLSERSVGSILSSRSRFSVLSRNAVRGIRNR